MSSAKIKQLEDEILDLRAKTALLSNYGQEKDRMLSTIGLLLSRLGGQAVIGPEDLPFFREWMSGRIIIEIEKPSMDRSIMTVRYLPSQEEQDAGVQDQQGT
jgi:hypothetical protein